MQADTALLTLVQQINQVISQLDTDHYHCPLPEFNGSSLGQHFRHILEFFQCLEDGVQSGTVDYAARNRNHVYETNPEIASAAFDAFNHALPNFDMAQPVQVRAEFGTDNRPCYESTVGRELLFVYDHAIHHLAIIKIGLICHYPEISVDKDLGVSPSTVKARAKMEN